MAGKSIEHLQLLYRPGERELAIEMGEALGCKVVDTGFVLDGSTVLSMHPDHDGPITQSNVIYITEVGAEQFAAEDCLRQLGERDKELGERLGAFRQNVREKPHGQQHIALRCSSGQEVEDAFGRLSQSLAPKLDGRLHLKLFRPGDPDSPYAEEYQGFIYQDVICSGSFLFGQVIELNGPR